MAEGWGPDRVPFDPACPPSDPPLTCKDPARWRSAFGNYVRHGSGPNGRCRHAVCGEPFPCAGRRLTVRALLDACCPDGGYSRSPGPDRVVGEGVCRWCGESIELRSRFGWVHTRRGFLLCEKDAEHAVPLSQAEPEEEGMPA